MKLSWAQHCDNIVPGRTLSFNLGVNGKWLTFICGNALVCALSGVNKYISFGQKKLNLKTRWRNQTLVWTDLLVSVYSIHCGCFIQYFVFACLPQLYLIYALTYSVTFPTPVSVCGFHFKKYTKPNTTYIVLWTVLQVLRCSDPVVQPSQPLSCQYQNEKKMC